MQKNGLHVQSLGRNMVRSSSSVLFTGLTSSSGRTSSASFRPVHHIQQRFIVSEAVYAFQTVAQNIQGYLQDFHTWSGLPWWVAIASSTIFVRTATFPLVRQQVLVSRKIAAAMPEISFLAQLLMSRLKTVPISNVEERMNLIGVFMKGVKACFVVHNVYVSEIFLYPMLNISVFVTFVYAVRDMVINGSLDLQLDSGGAFWFTDLSEMDKTFILPLYATFLSYMAIDLGTARAQGKLMMFIRDALQTIVMLSLPMVTQLPAGVFCYWIPSSCYGIAQSQMLKSPKFQKIFGIPPLPLPPAPKTTN
jgi:YidC/Oxa1 family membrane protein insertase